jgi:hypothetical protein
MKKPIEQDDPSRETSFDELEPIDEWTLDDLEQSADLGSVRSAFAHVDASNG